VSPGIRPDVPNLAGGNLKAMRGRNAIVAVATGWAWTTAGFWRATNLRYFFASHGEPLTFGPVELWLAPVFTTLAGAALTGSLVLLLNRDSR